MQRSQGSRNSKPISGVASASSGNGNQKASKRGNKNGGNKSQNSQRVQTAPVSGYSSHGPKRSPIMGGRQDTKIVSNDEFIGNIAGSVAFGNTQFSVNPGLSATFPWLALESVGWERYRFRKLQFYTTTQCATTATGAVILAPDYDSSDAAPASEQILMDYRDRVDGPPWKIDELICSLRPELLNESYKSHFIRFGALAANQDIKTYDAANFNVGVVGQAGTANVSKLHVRYTCEFFNPQLPPGGSPIPNSGTLAAAGGSIAAATPFGAVPVSVGPITLSAAATNVITAIGLTVGNEYTFAVGSAGTVISGYSFSSPTGMTSKNTIFQGFPVAATTGGAINTFTATATTATVTLSIVATTITFGFLTVAMVNTSSF